MSDWGGYKKIRAPNLKGTRTHAASGRAFRHKGIPEGLGHNFMGKRGNPYHDALGRFTHRGGVAAFRSPAETRFAMPGGGHAIIGRRKGYVVSHEFRPKGTLSAISVWKQGRPVRTRTYNLKKIRRLKHPGIKRSKLISYERYKGRK